MSASGQLGAADIAGLREQIDRDALDGLINDYFHALDIRDSALLATVFTESARYVVVLADGSVYEMGNRDAIVAGCTFVRSLVSNHHGLCNRSLSFDANGARADVRGLDVLAEVRDGSSRLVSQGLHYLIEFEKGDGAWRIVSSMLRISWQDLVPHPRLLAEELWPRSSMN